jgi:3'(2'), 5'-bisphosphate nucleotidase
MQPGISRSKSSIGLLLVSLVILAFSFLTPSTVLPRLRLFTSHVTPTALRPITTTATMASYSQELNIALLAVQRATLLTKSVFHSHAKGTLSKNDASPVTIGDFGAQALIIAALQHAFPNDEIVAEEEAKDLRENESLRNLVWDLVQNAKLADASAEETLGGPVKSAEQMLDIIDKGDSKGGASGRIWAIDPIDGTKGFLRGGQYAVCLGLMVDGVLISAVQGQGAVSRPLGKGALAEGHSIQMKPLEKVSEATFCESVEAGHSSQGDAADIARKLGITKPSVRMDSQAKYGSIARGAGDLYLRLPVKKDYQEKIWDHAAGDLIVREAGGEVTDTEGKRLDFSHGRTLKENKGVIAAPKSVHAEVIEVVKSVLGGK